MRNFANDLLTQLRGIWSRLDGGQRLVVLSVVGATLVGLGSVVWFAGRPSYETVFQSISGDDLRSAQQALTSAGVGYEVATAGDALLVERANIGRANLAIRAAGLGAKGEIEVGGTSSLIEDAETKAWKLDAASRAAAAAAIQQLDGVQSVTVTASRPRRAAAFRDRDREFRASASVLLRLRSGVAFEPIARSAASLAASQLMVPLENIDIVSATGSQRWRYDPDREAGGGSTEFLSLQRSMSDERTRLAQERLDQLWPGKTSVAVTVELDPSWEVRSEKVLPAEKLVRMEKSTKDATEATTPKSGEANSTDGRNTTSKETKDKEYVTEIGERRVGKLAPEIRRMSVAVLYDRSLEGQNFLKDDLVNAVKAIVGWDPQRDKPEAFSTLVGEFATPEALPEVAAGPGLGEQALRWAPIVGQVVGVLVVVMFLRGLFKRASRSPAAVAAEKAAAEPEKPLSPEEQQRRMRQEIERSIASDPASLAKLLESWLTEQKA